MVAELGHPRHAECTGCVGRRRLTIDDNVLKMVLLAIDSNCGMTAKQPAVMFEPYPSLEFNVDLRNRAQNVQNV
jgi:hypothetical protein